MSDVRSRERRRKGPSADVTSSWGPPCCRTPFPEKNFRLCVHVLVWSSPTYFSVVSLFRLCLGPLFGTSSFVYVVFMVLVRDSQHLRDVHTKSQKMRTPSCSHFSSLVTHSISLGSTRPRVSTRFRSHHACVHGDSASTYDHKPRLGRYRRCR